MCPPRVPSSGEGVAATAQGLTASLLLSATSPEARPQLLLASLTMSRGELDSGAATMTNT